MNSRHLADWIPSLVDDYAAPMEPPRIYVLWEAIAAISAALERKCVYKHGADLSFYPNMFIIIVGHSGLRKSVAVKLASGMLEDIGMDLGSESTSSSRLLGAMAEKFEAKGHASMAIFGSELSGFFKGTRADPDLFKRLMVMYDCDSRFKHDTWLHGEIEPRNLYLVLTGGMTEEGVNQHLPAHVVGEGFTSRVVFVWANKLRNLDDDPARYDTQARRDLRGQLVEDLARIGAIEGEFTREDEWKRKWAEWYKHENQKTAIPGRVYEGYNSRRGTHLIKLSMISSASRGSDRVMTGLDFDRAKLWLTEAEAYMPMVLSAVSDDVLAMVKEEVLQLLHQHGQMPLIDLAQHFYGRITTIDLSVRVMNELVALEIVRRKQVKVDNQPQMVYYLPDEHTLRPLAKQLVINLKRRK